MIKFTKKRDNRFTSQILDAFFNADAREDPEKLTDLFMVLEYIPNNLSELLTNVLDEDFALKLVYNMLLCLKYIHAHNIVHRDLKPSNILINSECKIRICDFGFSRSLKTVNKKDEKPKKRMRPMSPVAFTREYRPPEVILRQKDYDEKADVWSFGCMVSEIV